MRAKYIDSFTDFGLKKFFGEFTIAEIARFNPAQIQAYESSLKYYRDLNNVIDTAFQDGETKGKLEGKTEGKMEIAANAIAGGFSNEIIAQLTGLSPEVIEQLRNDRNGG